MFRRKSNRIPPLTRRKDVVAAVVWCVVAAALYAGLVVDVFILGASPWMLLVGLWLGATAAALTDSIRHYRYWRQHVRLAALYDQIGERVKWMYDHGIPRLGGPSRDYLHQADHGDDDVFLAVYRRDARWLRWLHRNGSYVVNRYNVTGMEDAYDALDEGRSAVMVGDAFVVTPGHVVLSYHTADAGKLAPDGTLVDPAPRRMSKWRRLLMARDMIRSGYAYMTEAETAVLAAQLAAAEPLSPPEQETVDA